MNKKNKTLLIALSITIIITIIICFVLYTIPEEEKASISSEVDIVEETVVEEVKEEVKLLSLDEVAKEVIAGNWGAGAERKTRLTEAGYNYEEVQARVDELMPKPQTKISTSTAISVPSGEYPEARLIWNIMRSWGWTQETCAGIIGNMMAEIGGGTLNLSNWSSNSGCGYGLIQWTSGRASAIMSRYGNFPNIEQQLTFMKDELFGTNGIRQQVNNNALNIIMNIDGTQTPESVAMCFASYYERCGQAYRARRQGFARIAYQYFTK